MSRVQIKPTCDTGRFVVELREEGLSGYLVRVGEAGMDVVQDRCDFEVSVSLEEAEAILRDWMDSKISRGESARVEIYNLVQAGRVVGTGWLVARLLQDGRRADTIGHFEEDEAGAREFASIMNAWAARA